jgi:hypothetical protein
MSVLACRFNYFLKLALTTQVMLFLDCIMLTRYIFIFCLKNPAAFQGIIKINGGKSYT